MELKGGERSGTFPGGFTHGVTNEKEARKGLRFGLRTPENRKFLTLRRNEFLFRDEPAFSTGTIKSAQARLLGKKISEVLSTVCPD